MSPRKSFQNQIRFDASLFLLSTAIKYSTVGVFFSVYITTLSTIGFITIHYFNPLTTKPLVFIMTSIYDTYFITLDSNSVQKVPIFTPLCSIVTNRAEVMFSAVLQADLVNISKEVDPDLVRHVAFINFTLCEMNIREEQKGLRENPKPMSPRGGTPAKISKQRFSWLKTSLRGAPREARENRPAALCITSRGPDSE